GGSSDSVLNNCTITQNTAQEEGGGAVLGTLNNCIVYHNNTATTDGIGPNYFLSTLNFSCTTPLPSVGVGNISADPQLTGASHLSAGSPCRQAGSSIYASGVDIDGEPWSNPPSIGCDEYQVDGLTGPVTVALKANYTNVASGFVVDFQGEVDGR